MESENLYEAKLTYATVEAKNSSNWLQITCFVLLSSSLLNSCIDTVKFVCTQYIILHHDRGATGTLFQVQIIRYFRARIFRRGSTASWATCIRRDVYCDEGYWKNVHWRAIGYRYVSITSNTAVFLIFLKITTVRALLTVLSPSVVKFKLLWC